jgi:hypothetical protein
MTTLVQRMPALLFLRRACLTLRRRKRQEFKEGKARVMSMLESAEESIKTKEGEGSSTSQDGQGQGEGEGNGKGAEGLAEAKAAAAVTLREASDLVGTLQGMVARASLFLREKEDTSASPDPLDAPQTPFPRAERPADLQICTLRISRSHWENTITLRNLQTPLPLSICPGSTFCCSASWQTTGHKTLDDRICDAAGYDQRLGNDSVMMMHQAVSQCRGKKPSGSHRGWGKKLEGPKTQPGLIELSTSGSRQPGEVGG